MYACIYELWKNCRGRTDGTGKSKVLQEVLADLKTPCKKRSCHHMIKIRGDIVTLWNSSMKVSSWTELRWLDHWARRVLGRRIVKQVSLINSMDSKNITGMPNFYFTPHVVEEVPVENFTVLLAHTPEDGRFLVSSRWGFLSFLTHLYTALYICS